MPRVKNPLPGYSDSEVLKVAARVVLSHPSRDCFALACRLRAIARRVPLWTDRQEISR